MRRHRRTSLPAENLAARQAWKEPHQGWCECGCDPKSFAYHLERHHVVSQQKLRQLGRVDVLWDMRNSILLCPRHHAWHTNHFRLIRIEHVPVAALEFALEVLGEGPSAAYFERYYNCEATL